MSNHSVHIGVDGAIRVDHHNDEAPAALQALTIAGGAQNVGASAPPNSMSEFDQMLQDYSEQQATKDQRKETNRRVSEAYKLHLDATNRLKTATTIATALINHGKTRGRDPQYIADKAHAIANALHDKVVIPPHPDYDEILRQVIAEDTPSQEQ